MNTKELVHRLVILTAFLLVYANMCSLRTQLAIAEHDASTLRYRVIENFGLTKVQNAALDECMGLSYADRDKDGGL